MFLMFDVGFEIFDDGFTRCVSRFYLCRMKGVGGFRLLLLLNLSGVIVSVRFVDGLCESSPTFMEYASLVRTLPIYKHGDTIHSSQSPRTILNPTVGIL